MNSREERPKDQVFVDELVQQAIEELEEQKKLRDSWKKKSPYPRRKKRRK